VVAAEDLVGTRGEKRNRDKIRDIGIRTVFSEGVDGAYSVVIKEYDCDPDDIMFVSCGLPIKI